MAVSESELAKARTLLGMLTAERRRRQLEEILSGLANLADIPDCGPLLPLTRHRWWQVRHEAIRVLGKCRDQRAEEALLAVLANPLDDHDRVYANASLGECGSAAAIAALAAQIHERAEDVKCSAVYALAKLGDSSTLPVFLDALNDRSPSVKWYAMAAIQQHGDEHAIAPVCARVTAMLSRHSKRNQHPETELIYALRFLHRYQDDDRARATLGRVTGPRLEYLNENESHWVREHLTSPASEHDPTRGAS